jgi:hypothetical protein
MADRRMISIPLPNPSEISLVVSDGHMYASITVDRSALENDPDGTILAAINEGEKKILTMVIGE